jgi:hypothetical protein
MIAIKYYEETPDEMYHYYSIYSFPENSSYPVFHNKYVSEWSKDLSVVELRRLSGNPSISGIIHTDVSLFYAQAYENRMIRNLDYYKFVDKEFKNGKTIEQIDAEWAKQQKIDDITESAKEFTC